MGIRKVAALMAFVACTSPPPVFSARGVEHLDASTDSDSIDLFFAERHLGVECDDCVIVEVIEGRERSAYFVHPEPSCTFRRIHSQGTRGGYDDKGKYAVSVGLNSNGKRELARCLRNSDPEHGSSHFLVVADGQALGTTFLSDHDLEFPWLFFHGTGLLEAVDRALSVFPTQDQEI